jgi:N-acetylmuramoyl-L-alanine amidase
MSKVLSFILIFVIFFPLLASAEPVSPKNYRVVIDPGHGGTDTGATHKDAKVTFYEKDFTLKLSLEIKRQLEQKKYPVTLTRERDQDVALNARTGIANREKAKIFISIHMNAFEPGAHKKADGVETFILNNTTDASSKRLAELENKGLDPTQGSDLTQEREVNLILKDLTIDANLSESKRLACAIQKQLISVTRQKARGVKQAMFVVLLGADMPSVLLEAGFMSSSNDRKLLDSVHGTRAMAAGIVRAIDQLRTEAGTAQARNELARCLVH